MTRDSGPEMNSAKRTIEIPVRQTPIELPLRIGRTDGTDAHLVTNARGDAIGSYFGLLPGMTLEQAHKTELTSKNADALEYMVNAINSYEALVGAMKLIHAIAPNRQTAELARKALIAAGELKE